VHSTDCSGQQPMPQTGDSSDTGQYESISSSTPNIVYAHINPAQECEMEYEEVRWKNDHALPCGSTQYGYRCWCSDAP